MDPNDAIVKMTHVTKRFRSRGSQLTALDDVDVGSWRMRGKTR